MDTGIESDLQLTSEGVDSPVRSGDIGGSLQVRYIFWHGLNYTTRSAREIAALIYYRLKDWI